MSPSVALTLLGFSVGTLIVINRCTTPRATLTLRERAIEAQRISAQASRRARNFAAQWNSDQEHR